MAASSPYESAPTMVRKPVTSHAPISSAGELTSRLIPAETIKMPEPIMDPMTRVVALVRPRPFTISELELACGVEALPSALDMVGLLLPQDAQKFLYGCAGRFY